MRDAKLRDAIERRDALLAKAAIAQAAFDNAKHLLCDAAERLKAELDPINRLLRNGTPERSWWFSELVHRRPLPNTSCSRHRRPDGGAGLP